MIGIILTLIIIFLLLLLVGIPFSVIVSYSVLILCILLAISLLIISAFFIGTLLSMPFFQKQVGTFVRFAHAEHFDRAVYEVDGEEYTCLFPAENVARERIYTSQPRKILTHKTTKRRTAYDRHSLTIITVGTIFSTGSVLGMIYYIMQLF